MVSPEVSTEVYEAAPALCTSQAAFAISSMNNTRLLLLLQAELLDLVAKEEEKKETRKARRKAKKAAASRQPFLKGEDGCRECAALQNGSPSSSPCASLSSRSALHFSIRVTQSRGRVKVYLSKSLLQIRGPC